MSSSSSIDKMFFPIVLSFILRQGDRDPCIFSGTALYLYCSVMKVNHLLHKAEPQSCGAAFRIAMRPHTLKDLWVYANTVVHYFPMGCPTAAGYNQLDLPFLRVNRFTCVFQQIYQCSSHTDGIHIYPNLRTLIVDRNSRNQGV